VQVTFNGHSRSVLASWPLGVVTAITDRQRQIEEFVLSVCPSAVPTSGFRDSRYNREVSTHGSGHEFSLHLCGAARDYAPDSVSAVRLDAAARKSGRFRVIVELVCVHVEMI